MKRTPIFGFAVLLTSALVVVAGCSSESQDATDSSPQPAVEQPAEDSAAVEPMPTELSASHILIMHKDSMRVPEEITRTKEEALALVTKIAGMLKDEGADFSTLAQEHSDCPSGATGGSLGNFGPEAMVPEFSRATLKLSVGEISDPVETDFGYHVILRQEVKEIPKASARHILVQYKGSMMASDDITRTKEEALARMEECLKKATEGGNFEELAREYSDGPTGPAGGDLGEFDKGMMHPAFDEAVFACEVGKITEIVETPFGYHIIYRYK